MQGSGWTAAGFLPLCGAPAPQQLREPSGAGSHSLRAGAAWGSIGELPYALRGSAQGEAAEPGAGLSWQADRHERS